MISFFIYVYTKYISNKTASSDTAANEVCEEIKTRAGDKGAMGIPMKANIGSAEEVQAMFAKIVETVGPVDILVNNAGRKIIHKYNINILSRCII